MTVVVDPFVLIIVGLLGVVFGMLAMRRNR
jgi:hypothetical protein